MLIPSLINPPTVLDLSPSQSLARFLLEQGHDPWLVDWGQPEPDDSSDLSAHVTDRLMKMLTVLPERPAMLGYCLGGTLAMAAAQLCDAQSLISVASPWHFDRMPEETLSQIARLWDESRSMCERIGYVPMELMQTGFWSMDPARTIRKYAGFANVAPGSDTERAFLFLEDWANAGPPLTFAAGRQLFEDFYMANHTGQGSWSVDGRNIAPDAIACASLSVASATDRIVPAACSPSLEENLTLHLGHVGMIVGSKAPEMLWRPLSNWLSKQNG